ncbi:MAG: hypothetical protein FWG45_07595, partial [Oscillospiraceae bacterium]|nr:hypothetical protein [Oscillospiraceae bacterium]
MRSSFMGLEVQKRSMQIAQKHLDIVGHNLGNSKTPGFTRQRVDIHSLHMSNHTYWQTRLSQMSIQGQGVSAHGVSQIRNAYLDRRFREMVPQAAEHSVMHTIMLELETKLDAVDTFSLLDAMNQLKSAMERVALERVDAREMTSLVRNETKNITLMLNTHYRELTKLMEDNLWELERSIETMNGLVGRIVDFNKAITREYVVDSGRIARGQGVSEYGPLEMLDQRNMLLDELAQFANIEVFQNNNGSVKVVMAGVTIIDDEDFKQLRMDEFSDFDAAVLQFSDGTAFRPQTGELKAYMEMLNGNGPYAAGSYQTGTFGIPYYINALNAYAQGFADILNDAMNASLNATGFSDKSTASHMVLPDGSVVKVPSLADENPPGSGTKQYTLLDGSVITVKVDTLNATNGERADNSHWQRALVWGGYEYNDDGSVRMELVQARDDAGRLIMEIDSTGNYVPKMIMSEVRAPITAQNIMITDEWMNDPLLCGMTFDTKAGALVPARDELGLITMIPHMVPQVAQANVQERVPTLSLNGDFVYRVNQAGQFVDAQGRAITDVADYDKRVQLYDAVWAAEPYSPATHGIIGTTFNAAWVKNQNGLYVDINGVPLVPQDDPSGAGRMVYVDSATPPNYLLGTNGVLQDPSKRDPVMGRMLFLDNDGIPTDGRVADGSKPAAQAQALDSTSGLPLWATTVPGVFTDDINAPTIDRDSNNRLIPIIQWSDGIDRPIGDTSAPTGVTPILVPYLEGVKDALGNPVMTDVYDVMLDANGNPIRETNPNSPNFGHPIPVRVQDPASPDFGNPVSPTTTPPSTNTVPYQTEKMTTAGAWRMA